MAASISPPLLFREIGHIQRAHIRAPAHIRRTVVRHDGTQVRAAAAAGDRTRTGMANTASAKKAARQMARRTVINKARRSRLRNYVGKVEDAISSGDRALALAALGEAEPVIMRAAQLGIVHKNSASRKVSRLTHRVEQLGK
jgi:small subunit ribosomal protein S20